MGFSNQTTQQQFPYSADAVFLALREAVRMSDMEIKESDSVLKRATISVGISLLSWGETVSISVQSQDDNSCVVTLDSSLNFSANLAGSHKHQKNFNKLLYSLSKVLRDDEADSIEQSSNSRSDVATNEPTGVKISYVIIIASILILGIPALILLTLK